MDALDQLNLAAPLVSTYAEVEETILCHIAEQLAANPDTLINATSEWRIKMLAQMGRVNKDTARIIASRVGKVPSEVERVVKSSIDKVLSEYELEMNGKIEGSIAAALKNYDLQAVKDKYNQVNTVMQYKAKQAYVNGINSVADKLLRKKQKALENSQEYLDILNKNAMATVMGEKSRTEAIRETIAEMSKKGIPAFVDKTGREWSPEAYVDMDIRNTAKNAALAAEFASLDELGQDIILVSSHSGSRPLCAPYQGKFYSISGKSGTITDAKGKTYTYTPLSDTSFGKPAGLFGINCGHRMRGASDGTFINREKEYDGEETSEEYRKVQRQREMERLVRKKKTEANMYEAAGDKDDARDLRRLAVDQDRQLREYCKKEGLHYRMDRTEVYGYLDTSVKKSMNKLSAVDETEITDKIRRSIKSKISAEKVVSYDKLPEKFRIDFETGLKCSIKETQTAIQKELKTLDICLTTDKKSIYNPALNIVKIREDALAGTFAHEIFHKIDKTNKVNIKNDLLTPLHQDWNKLIENSNGDIISYLVTNYPNAFITNRNGKIVFREEYRGISDILSGLSNNDLSLGYFHSKKYWSIPNKLQKEAWAQFGRITYDNLPEVQKMFTEIFTKYNESAIIALKAVV